MTENLKISLVTPTYNSAQYLERTLKSVLSQNYPALEYIVIDGDSTDATTDIIRQYEHQLSYWQSEPDKGMYDAIQKGFAHSSGEIMGYLNSDDMHMSHTLATVNAIFQDLPEVQWITSLRPLIWNAEDLPIDVIFVPGYHRKSFWRGEHMAGGRYIVELIQQESSFWRRELWEKAGGMVDTSLKLAGDFELWARFYQHSNLYGVRTILGGFRLHGEQLSYRNNELYREESLESLLRHGGKPHNALSILPRKLSPLVPKKLRRPASWLGILNKTQNIVYDIGQRKWVLRYDYI